jgi:hypothetical protein
MDEEHLSEDKQLTDILDQRLKAIEENPELVKPIAGLMAMLYADLDKEV